MKPAFECTCANCRSACTYKPGLFMPGEAEALAAGMGISFDELLKTRLSFERVSCRPYDIWVLAPAQDCHNACVFFEEDRCAIHALGKPHECAAATHESGASLAEIVNAWLPYQTDIWSRLFPDPYLVGPPAWGQ